MSEIVANLDRERALKRLALMERIRAFEETAMRALSDGLVLGAIHPSIGQEAIAAGIVSELRREDVLLSTHRGHGHTLAKGANALAMMRELLGRAGGNCAGKGGSMHIADFEVGMLGANGVVGANIVIAAGAAHAIRLKRESRIVCCIFGDGAINRGPFLEGLNWAKVHELPIVFVCENNGFAATTRSDAMTAGAGAHVRAESLGLAACEVDGNDVLALAETARDAFDAARSGQGPQFIHARTYRLSGHTAADPATYRSDDEVAVRRDDDPIARLRDTLRLAGVEDDEMDTLTQIAARDMALVYKAARDTDFPDTAAAFSDVQDVGSPADSPY